MHLKFTTVLSPSNSFGPPAFQIQDPFSFINIIILHTHKHTRESISVANYIQLLQALLIHSNEYLSIFRIPIDICY